MTSQTGGHDSFSPGFAKFVPVIARDRLDHWSQNGYGKNLTPQHAPPRCTVI